MRLHGDLAVTPDIETPTGFTERGAEHIPPIFTDGVLLDVAAMKGVQSLDPGAMLSPPMICRRAATGSRSLSRKTWSC